MIRKRRGNDIRVEWAIFDGEGNGYDLEDKDIILTVKSSLCRVPYGDLTIDGNVISFTVFGKDQKELGRYTAILVENNGVAGMKTVDIVDAFYLVPHTHMESGGDSCSHLNTYTVNLTSEVISGIPGPRGLSLYDYAVKYYGFGGTEREFWQWFHAAKVAADTAAENAAAAQQRIEASEAERARTFTDLEVLIRAAVDNADSLVDRLRTFPTVFVDELPEASIDTLYSFYLVPNPLDPDVQDIYLTEKKEDGTYGWRKVGGTNIAFNEYFRKDDVVVLTEDEYDAIREPDPNKFYLTIEDAGEEVE